MRSFRNKIKQMDRRLKNALCALLLAVGIIMTGVSLAYFVSRDEVSNHLEGVTYLRKIVLTEPEWGKTGSTDAKKSVPGMEIAKDPYTTNLLTANVYIRMKLEFVIDTDGDGTYETISGPVTNDAGETETLTLFDYYYETDAAKKSLTNQTGQITSDNKGYTYSRLLSAVYYNTTTTDETTGEQTTVHNHLVNLVDKTDTDGTTTKAISAKTNNPYFYYYDGWFYYLDFGNTDTAKRTNLKKMAYQEKTKVPLFTDVKLPVFKDEYNDLFANGFRINVVVQAVDENLFTDGEETYIPNVTKDTIGDIDNAFDKEMSSQ